MQANPGVGARPRRHRGGADCHGVVRSGGGGIGAFRRAVVFAGMGADCRPPGVFPVLRQRDARGFALHLLVGRRVRAAARDACRGAGRVAYSPACSPSWAPALLVIALAIPSASSGIGPRGQPLDRGGARCANRILDLVRRDHVRRRDVDRSSPKDLSDNVEGAYVLRNGFAQAVAMRAFVAGGDGRSKATVAT